MIKIIKLIYLDCIRFLVFRILFFLTICLRKKTLNLENVKNIIVVGQNRIGDNVLSIPALRTIRKNFSKAKIVIISNRYVKDILLEDGSVNEILFYRRENISGKIKTISMLLKRKWDLGIDFTIDYTFLPAFLLFLSGSRSRIGYNIKGRGFLFHRPVKWDAENKHFIDRLSDLIKGIGFKIIDKKASLSVSDNCKKLADEFLKANDVQNDDNLIGIHPGGYFPSQRWPIERFAETADNIIKKHNAKLIIIGGGKEKRLLGTMISLMKEKAIEAYNSPMPQLMGLIKRCGLLICNNSGILHLATALDVPTVSTMGPTDSSMWWPQGENNIVLKKDVSCLGCEDAYCETHECMNSITIDDMLEAVSAQVKKYLD